MTEKTPSELIDGRIAELGDWRGEMLAKLRGLMKAAVPDVVEEWKWRGVPTWYCDGMICTGETYKKVVKLTFAKGASLDDPKGLFHVGQHLTYEVCQPSCVGVTGVDPEDEVVLPLLWR